MRKGEYSQYYTILLLELIAAAFDISWFFQGLEEFKKTVIRNILVRIVSVSCIFIFVKEPQDLNKFIFIYSLADLVGNLSLWLYLPKYLDKVEILPYHDMGRFKWEQLGLEYPLDGVRTANNEDVERAKKILGI